MSVIMEGEIKRWTARRKAALVLVLEIIRGETTVSEASRQFDLVPSEIEEWMEHAKAASLVRCLEGVELSSLKWVPADGRPSEPQCIVPATTAMIPPRRGIMGDACCPLS